MWKGPNSRKGRPFLPHREGPLSHSILARPKTSNLPAQRPTEPITIRPTSSPVTSSPTSSRPAGFLPSNQPSQLLPARSALLPPQALCPYKVDRIKKARAIHPRPPESPGDPNKVGTGHHASCLMSTGGLPPWVGVPQPGVAQMVPKPGRFGLPAQPQPPPLGDLSESGFSALQLR